MSVAKQFRVAVAAIALAAFLAPSVAPTHAFAQAAKPGATSASDKKSGAKKPAAVAKKKDAKDAKKASVKKPDAKKKKPETAAKKKAPKDMKKASAKPAKKAPAKKQPAA